ncbi:HTH-like domain-containing protein [Pseudoalteromonas piscicida]|uniref:HTH-like domain-containing protein n=1 Tax=Pseudoalteromonas piscicida TaxID=43662 RepID=UPI003C7B25AD
MTVHQALESVPLNQYMAKFHYQMLKYASELQSITAKKSASGRLKQADLDVSKM